MARTPVAAVAPVSHAVAALVRYALATCHGTVREEEACWANLLGDQIQHLQHR